MRKVKEVADPTINELAAKAKEYMKDFSSLLESIELEEKKKKLWKQIYENAITDRMNAYIAFMDLYSQVHGDIEQHVVSGAILSKYLERISRSNDQLLKLSEMITNVMLKQMELKAEKENAELSMDEIYDKIQEQSKK